VTGLAKRTVWNATGVDRPDALTVEEPLEIRVGYGPLSQRKRAVHNVTMRTPGHDRELTIGLLRTDGVIAAKGEMIEFLADRPNEVRVELHHGVSYDVSRHRRTGYSSSACGLCGQHEIQRITDRLEPIQSSLTISSPLVMQLPNIARKHQSLFQATGGSHAAARFDPTGRFDSLFEDVGRHNALDKLIGHAMIEEQSLSDSVLFLSGRAGFEMVQKAAIVGVPMLVAVGAPTNLAIELADHVGMTLIGFVREFDFNTYSHPQRVTR
jgi:FdhD protein